MPSKVSMPWIPGNLALLRMPPAMTKNRLDSWSPRLVVISQRWVSSFHSAEATSVWNSAAR